VRYKLTVTIAQGIIYGFVAFNGDTLVISFDDENNDEIDDSLSFQRQ